VGEANTVTADIYLGKLTPQDVTVELYYGMVDMNGEIEDPQVTEMEPQGADESAAPLGANGVYSFKRQLTCKSSGMHGFTVRVVPDHPHLVSPFETSLIRWG
jgi:starch phosphorylase